MTKTHGFTIIELMIVVGIIGVIASIAIPIYRDYLTRAKVSEAMNLLGGLKNPMVEYYHDRGGWPAVTSLGGQTSGKYTSIIVSGGTVDNLLNGHQFYWLEATMKGGELDGKQLRARYILTYGPDSFGDWDCTTDGVSNPIPKNFLPSPCW